MAIFVDDKTKVVYQGLTGSQGRFYGLLNRDYGTQVVAGHQPEEGGHRRRRHPRLRGRSRDAVEATGATASCIFIPAPGVKDAVIEAAEGGVKFIVAITEGVPAHDEAWFYNKLKRDFPDVQLLGPNCPGIISPGKANIGITAGHIAKAPVEGRPNVGIVSRSGTLTYQALYELKLNDIGVTTCVGIGGDPVPGTSFIDCLQAFEADPDTRGRDDDRRDRRVRRGGGRRLHRRRDDASRSCPTSRASPPLPARRWATPAPSCRGARAPRPPSRRRSAAAGVRIGQNPTEAGTLMVEVVKHL